MIKRLTNIQESFTFDIPLIVTTTAMVIFGLVMIYDASVVAALRDFGDKLYYFKNQLIWASIGFIALAFFSLFDYHKLIKIAPFGFLAACLFLLLVLIPGIGSKVYGARRWINLGSLTFQPSEFAKLAMIFYQSYIMSKYQNIKLSIFDIGYVMFLPILFMTGLIALEPDLGTALIFAGIAAATYFVSGGSLWHFAIMIPATVSAAVAAILAEPYRLERLKAFFDPTYDPQGASYQINQILFSLANGGIFGVGIGGSRGKFDFIPEIHSDAIFAVVAEELGFTGAIILIGIFIYLIFRAVKIAKEAGDFQGRVLASAIAALISIQTFLNLASIVALVPLTGIPLPFISYGGSSLLVTMISIGILNNIKRQSK